MPSDTRKIDKKKKNALYANGSGPDPPSSSDTSVTSPAFIDVFLPVRAARISSFPRALPPLPKLEPVSFFPSFQGDEIAGEELLDEPIEASSNNDYLDERTNRLHVFDG